MRPVRTTGQKLLWGVLIGVPVASILIGIILRGGDRPASIFRAVLLLVLLILWLGWWTRGRIRVDANGIHSSGTLNSNDLIRSRSGTFQSEDLIEVGWYRSIGHVGIMVRPHGGRWDDPGPNSPAAIGMMHSNRRAHHGGERLLREWCEQHGVRFVADGGSILKRPAPGQPGGPSADQDGRGART